MDLLNTRPRILAITDYYPPVLTSSGPIQALANLSEKLQNEFEFYIFTRGRHWIDRRPVAGLKSDQWIEQGSASVWYASEDGMRMLLQAMRSCAPDVIYLNSFFSRLSMRLLWLRRIGKVAGLPVILGPRGEFSVGALGLKSWRKRIYVSSAARLGMLEGICWHASGSTERADIERMIGNGSACRVVVAPDIISAAGSERGPGAARKIAGRARFVFLARLNAMKNLEFALALLGRLRGDVCFDIYGPKESPAYWAMCEQEMGRLPGHVRARYCGELPHAEVEARLAEYDFFLLPSRGENFGHAILEASHAGLPVVISDQTPWRGLPEQQVGWDLPLATESWLPVLQACVDMPGAEHATLSQNARRFARRWIDSPEVIAANHELFRSALRRPTSCH